jgi:ribosomal protein L19
MKMKAFQFFQLSQYNKKSSKIINIQNLRKGQLVRLFFIEEKILTFFRGRILSIHNAGNSSTFILRRRIRGINIERIFHIYAPFLRQIEILDYSLQKVKN